MFDLDDNISSTQATAKLRGPPAASLAMRYNTINAPASSLSSLVGHASNSVASYRWSINGIFGRSGTIAVFLVGSMPHHENRGAYKTGACALGLAFSLAFKLTLKPAVAKAPILRIKVPQIA
jgi:hypothetical protein